MTRLPGCRQEKKKGGKQTKYLFFCLNSRKSLHSFTLLPFCLSIFLLWQSSPLTCSDQSLLRSPTQCSEPSKSAPQPIIFFSLWTAEANGEERKWKRGKGMHRRAWQNTLAHSFHSNFWSKTGCILDWFPLPLICLINHISQNYTWEPFLLWECSQWRSVYKRWTKNQQN